MRASVAASSVWPTFSIRNSTRRSARMKSIRDASRTRAPQGRSRSTRSGASSIAEIHERGVLEFSVILLDSDKNRIEAQAVARVLRLREEAFAARDIAQGKMLERGDLELRRVEATEESPGPDLSSLIGSRAAARIRKGAKVSHSELTAVGGLRPGED